MTGSQEFVHDNSILHFQTGGLSKLVVRFDAKTRHHAVHQDFSLAPLDGKLVASLVQTRTFFAGDDLHPFLSIEVRYEFREFPRKKFRVWTSEATSLPS